MRAIVMNEALQNFLMKILGKNLGVSATTLGRQWGSS